jgi:hypothetical protein
MTAQISQIRTVADGIAKFRPTEQAGTRARALEDVVTVSDESPYRRVPRTRSWVQHDDQ